MKFNIVTSQLSSSPIHPNLWKGLLTLKKELEADGHSANLIVIAQYWENCNALIRDDSEKTQWVGHPDTAGYLLRDSILELEGAIIRADVNIRPASLNPISAANSFASNTHKHVIFAHPQIALQTMPRPLNGQRQSIYTTGSITLPDSPNYRRSQTEQRAQFHHSLGFLVVCGGHVWPVYANKDGSFNFLVWHINGNEIADAEYTMAVLGDLHAPNHDVDMTKQVCDLLLKLGIREVVLQDAIDIQYGSHHATKSKDRLVNYQAWGSLTNELKAAKEVLEDFNLHFNLHLIESNHHQHLDVFLEKTHDKVDPQDLLIYYRLNYLRHLTGKTAFKCLLEAYQDILWYDDRNPLIIGDKINVYHGDRGICGAKGSARSFDKAMGTALVGHTHAEEIFRGIINMGCLAKLPQGYQSGFTKSTHGIALVDKFNKRHLITAQNTLLLPF
jgi:hypothetical protein